MARGQAEYRDNQECGKNFIYPLFGVAQMFIIYHGTKVSLQTLKFTHNVYCIV